MFLFYNCFFLSSSLSLSLSQSFLPSPSHYLSLSLSLLLSLTNQPLSLRVSFLYQCFNFVCNVSFLKWFSSCSFTFIGCFFVSSFYFPNATGGCLTKVMFDKSQLRNLTIKNASFVIESISTLVKNDLFRLFGYFGTFLSFLSKVGLVRNAQEPLSRTAQKFRLVSICQKSFLSFFLSFVRSFVPPSKFNQLFKSESKIFQPVPTFCCSCCFVSNFC